MEKDVRRVLKSMLENTNYEEFMQREIPQKEQEPNLYPSIIGGFDCRILYEVVDNNKIRRRVEFKALNGKNPDNLSEEGLRRLKLRQDELVDEIEVDKQDLDKILKSNDLSNINNERNEEMAYKKENAELNDMMQEKLADLFNAQKKITIALKNNVLNVNENDKKTNTKGYQGNKVYDKKKDSYDYFLDEFEKVTYEKSKLRKLGINVEEDFLLEKSINKNIKVLSSISFIYGLYLTQMLPPNIVDVLTQTNSASFALCWAGISGYALAKVWEKKSDFKYKKALLDLQKAYLEDKIITDEEIKYIVGNDNVKIPDEFELAVLPKEEREEWLRKQNSVEKFSTKEKTKRIKKALKNLTDYGTLDKPTRRKKVKKSEVEL